MLLELRIRGLGAIEDAHVELGPGFTAVTGETGAGKTMLLTGLALLLGGRGDSGMVRADRGRVEVEGRFRVPVDGAVTRRVAEAGGELDGPPDAPEVLIARTITSDGRSRAYLGGRTVPVGVLAALADDLVVVHGQADQRGLLRPSRQRAALDAYAGLHDLVHDYSNAFSELVAVRRDLADLLAHRRERTVEAAGLRQGLDDVDRLELRSGEDAALRDESARLGQADGLRRAATLAHQAISGSDNAPEGSDALTMLGTARHELDGFRGVDSELDSIAERLAQASYLVADLGADLARYADGMDADPGRLAAVQERIAALTVVVRRYGTAEADVDGVLTWAAAARERLIELDADDDRSGELAEHADQTLTAVRALAQQLSDARCAAASSLEAAVSTELSGLAMPQAQLLATVRQRDDDHGLDVGGRTVAFGAHGVDDVAFELVAHAGAPARPLHRGASGGELSRIMLALEVVIAGTGDIPCFVFDEIDAGVGGKAAIEVGRRLADLAGRSQVLVVTHLPQVAAFADRHVVVTKTHDGLVTESAVDLVDGETRLRELSRMLGGLETSELGHGHAQELLETASAAKASTSRSVRR